jgi:hemoglobin/transferrin/lactoferrin receptor protein
MKKRLLFLIISCAFLSALLAGEDQKKDNSEPADKASEKTQANGADSQPALHYDLIVTATSYAKQAFDLAIPVSVDKRNKIEELAPNNVADLINLHPGMDITGIAPNQTRPIIRGLRGQRILLLEDGVRLNNSRRQQDFGESSGLVDIGQVERVEVVRGPASVLYGSDAIGGVINIITRNGFTGQTNKNLVGAFGVQYDSAGNQHHETFSFGGRSGKFDLQIAASYRQAGNFSAAKGKFGAIELKNAVSVIDSGLQDHSLSAMLNFKPDDHQNFCLKHEYYNANDSGFGFVEPILFAPQTTRIQITYPFQVFNKTSLRYENHALRFFAGDSVSAQFYLIGNNRKMNNNIFIPFNSPWLPANAGLAINTENITEIATCGFRLEARKVLFAKHILTYGSDFYSDNAENADKSTTQMQNMGRPFPATLDQTPELPNAWYNSLGFFVQDDVKLTKRFSVIAGLRYQTVKARTLATPGLENARLFRSVDQTMTGAINFIYGLTDNLNLSFALGRAFRSPNLIERFFNGITPEGAAFQSQNPDLKAETSLNLDFGVKYRLESLYCEANYFNNTIRDGIRIVPSGEKVNGFDEYRNQNIDKLRLRGIELEADYRFGFGMAVSADYTWIKSTDLVNPATPYTNTYSSRLNIMLRYDSPQSIWWSEYRLRINGKQQDMIIVGNPIGPFIPGYSVHDLAAGIKLFKQKRCPQRLGLILANLTNTLYAEFSNAMFFRPAPKRHLVLTWNTSF